MFHFILPFAHPAPPPQNCTRKGLGSPGSVGSFWVGSSASQRVVGASSCLLGSPSQTRCSSGLSALQPHQFASPHVPLKPRDPSQRSPLPSPSSRPPCPTRISPAPGWRRILMVLSHQRLLPPYAIAPPPPHSLTCHPTALLPPWGAAFCPKLQHGVALLILHHPEAR